MQRDALVERGVGLPGEDLDMVAEFDEGFREVACVDALATDRGLAPVREEGDAQRRPSRRPRGLIQVWASLRMNLGPNTNLSPRIAGRRLPRPHLHSSRGRLLRCER